MDNPLYKGFKVLSEGLNVLIGANGAGKSGFLELLQDEYGVPVYHFCATHHLKEKHPAADNFCFQPDAYNLAPHLRKLREKYKPEYQRIVGTISLVAPFFDDFVDRQTGEEFIELEWLEKSNSDMPLKAWMLSDGTLRFICLATLLLQPIELLPHTVLIDEPELGLNPYAIAILATMFRQVAERRQLIVSTQSVELLNNLKPKDIIVIERDGDDNSFNRFSSEELSGWLEKYTLGELWLKNVLGGRP